MDDFEGREPLRRLFWTELNYERRNDPLSMRGWPDTVSGALVEQPTVLASGGFEVIYCRPASDRLSLAAERRVMERSEKAFALISDKDRAAYDGDEDLKPSHPNYEPSEF